MKPKIGAILDDNYNFLFSLPLSPFVKNLHFPPLFLRHNCTSLLPHPVLAVDQPRPCSEPLALPSRDLNELLCAASPLTSLLSRARGGKPVRNQADKHHCRLRPPCAQTVLCFLRNKSAHLLFSMITAADGRRNIRAVAAAAPLPAAATQINPGNRVGRRQPTRYACIIHEAVT